MNLSQAMRAATFFTSFLSYQLDGIVLLHIFKKQLKILAKGTES